MTRRILLVGSLPPPVGGITVHLAELARALRLRGARVDAIDPRRHGPDGTDGRPRLALRLGRAALSGALVHVHTNGHNPRSWQLALACALSGHALLTVHSGLAPGFMQTHQTLVRQVCKRIKFVIAVSPPIAEALLACGVEPARIEVLPAFSPSSVAWRLAPAGLGSIRRRHQLLLACAVVADQPEYGLDVMLDAMMQVHQIDPAAGLLLYGPGTRAPECATEVRARGLADSVHLFGELSRERALGLLAAADLFVRPSRADGDALSVREALALGRAVVASTASLRPPGVVLFRSGSPAALTEAIFHAIGKPMDTNVPPDTSSEGCIEPLMRIYRRAGLDLAVETTGTPFAETSA